jgi:branched-chain amino acid transport system permease protein
MGIPRIPPAEIVIGDLLSISFKTKLSYYYLVITSIFVLLYIKRRLYGSKMGRALIAVREDEDLAKSVGISTNFYKVTIFAVSTAIAGFAGVLYAHYVRFIGPDSFTMVQSFNYFVMNLIGGSGTMIGPLIGPLLLTTIDELSQLFKPEIARVLFGLALIVIILYMPKGIMGLLHRMASREKI